MAPGFFFAFQQLLIHSFESYVQVGFENEYFLKDGERGYEVNGEILVNEKH